MFSTMNNSVIFPVIMVLSGALLILTYDLVRHPRFHPLLRDAHGVAGLIWILVFLYSLWNGTLL